MSSLMDTVKVARGTMWSAGGVGPRVWDALWDRVYIEVWEPFAFIVMDQVESDIPWP